MSIVSPFHDVCVAGCLANAALTASPKRAAAVDRSDAALPPSSHCAEMPAQAAPGPTRRLRLFAAVLNLVSGPTMPRGV